MRTLVKNPLIYVGLLIALGSALLWLGAVVLEKIKEAFPWFGGFGLLLVVAGFLLELRKARMGQKAEVAQEGKAD